MKLRITLKTNTESRFVEVDELGREALVKLGVLSIQDDIYEQYLNPCATAINKLIKGSINEGVPTKGIHCSFKYGRYIIEVEVIDEVQVINLSTER